MPGQIRGPVATAQFPISLSKKFSESHAVQTRLNEYHDGSTHRQSLVTESRRTWSLTKRLTISEMLTLWNFWQANRNTVFGFYNPHETIPPFTKDPAGTSGYYLVRFASDWDQQIDIARSEVSVELIEVAKEVSVVSTPPIITPPPPPPPPPAPTGAFLTVRTAFATDPVLLPRATVSIYGTTLAFGHIPEIYSNDSWSVRNDTADVTVTLLNPQLTTSAGIAALNVYFFIDNFSQGSGSADFDIYDVYLTRVAPDFTSVVYRPTATAVQMNTGTGSISNPGNAIDGDPATFTRIHGNAWFPLNVPPAFSVAGFR